MGWGTELWDRRANIEAATAESIEFIGTFKAMLLAVAEVESTYSKAMRKALKPFYGVMAADNSTEAQAYKQMLGSFEGMAVTHEQLADRITGDMSNPLDALMNEKRKHRQHFLNQLAALDQKEAKELAVLGKARKKYEKIEKDADDAEAVYLKAQQADNVTLGKVEKLRDTWEKKSRIRDAEEVTLKQATDEVNSFRTTHYHVELPAVIDQLQLMHMDRGTKLMAEFKKISDIYGSCNATIKQAIDQLNARIAAFDAAADSKNFIEVYKSGAGPPQDIPLHPPGSSRGAKIRQGQDQPAVPQQQQYQQQQQQQQQQRQQTVDDDDEPLPEMQQQILILYDFPGTNEGELPCSANEWLNMISNDGSGWVLASKQDGTQGYVPSTYINGMS